MKFTLSSATVISVLTCLSGTHAWGRDGHAIVATIAELHLDPTVLPILCSILKTSRPEEPCTLASVASWADEHKSKWSAPMHYVNPIADHPPQLCLFPGAKGWDGAKKINILGAIRNTTDLLDHWVEQGSDLENPVASEALKFLIHFVGDMHMPFHLTARGRGGGEFYVGWAGKRVSLHALWDGKLVDRAIETTPSKWDRPLAAEIERHLHGNDYDPLIRKVLAEGIKQTWADEVGSWTICPVTNKSPPQDGDSDGQIAFQSQWVPSETDDGYVCPWYWADPIHNFTCEWVWPKQLDEPPYNEPRGPLLKVDDEAYGGKVTREWVVEKLLTMAGLRLASTLNLIFALTNDP